MYFLLFFINQAKLKILSDSDGVLVCKFASLVWVRRLKICKLQNVENWSLVSVCHLAGKSLVIVLMWPTAASRLVLCGL